MHCGHLKKEQHILSDLPSFEIPEARQINVLHARLLLYDKSNPLSACKASISVIISHSHKRKAKTDQFKSND